MDPVLPESLRPPLPQPAVVGLVTEAIPDHVHDGMGEPEPILELLPLCLSHGPETIHETAISSNQDEWSIVSFGSVDGGLS